MLVHEKVVQNVDGSSAGGEYLLNQLHRVRIDDDLAGVVRNFNFRLQDIQPGMHHIQGRPGNTFPDGEVSQ